MEQTWGRKMNDAREMPAQSGSLGQLVRYGVVGIVSNLAGYLLFLLITWWGVEHKSAMSMLYLAGATVGFFGNRQWAFAHTGTLLGAGVRYAGAHLCGYLLNLLLLFVFADRLGYPYQWVQAAAVFIVAGFLFVVFKYFVFPRTGQRVKGVQ